MATINVIYDDLYNSAKALDKVIEYIESAKKQLETIKKSTEELDAKHDCFSRTSTELNDLEIAFENYNTEVGFLKSQCTNAANAFKDAEGENAKLTDAMKGVISDAAIMLGDDSLKNNPEILGGADSQFVKPKVKEGSNKISSNKKGGKSVNANQSQEEDDENDNVPEATAKKNKKENADEKFDIDKIKSISLIIRDMKDIDFIIKKINVLYAEEDLKFKNINLLYSASEDGDACTIFHSMCDGISPLLVFIKTNKGLRFGGFTAGTFECSTTYKGKVDDKAFIFSLDRKKIYEVEKGTKAICCYKNYGPVFYGYEYCNIYLVGNFLTVEGNVAKKGDRYNTTEDYELNGGEKKFMAEEVEVFQVFLGE